MKKRNKIEFYKKPRNLYDILQFTPSYPLEEFHIFRFEDLKETKNYMPPYRRGFFQFTYIKDFGNSKLSIDSLSSQNINTALYFVGPNRILSWVRDKTVKGYLIHVKSSFFGLSDHNLEERFSFFAPSANHVLEINRKRIAIEFQNSFQELLSIQNNDKLLHKKELLHHLLMVFLYKSEQLYQETFGLENKSSYSISKKFKRLVEQYYLGLKSIDEYAELMSLTSNYLSQVVKSETGQSPKTIIDQRVVLEGKNMLIHTDFTINEIAFHLGFKEGTHFSRFFKRMEILSPLEFRKKNAKI